MGSSAFFDCGVVGHDPAAISRIATTINRGGHIDAVVLDGRIELRSTSVPDSGLRLAWKTCLANELGVVDGAPFRAEMMALLIG